MCYSTTEFEESGIKNNMSACSEAGERILNHADTIIHLGRGGASEVQGVSIREIVLCVPERALNEDCMSEWKRRNELKDGEFR